MNSKTFFFPSHLQLFLIIFLIFIIIIPISFCSDDDEDKYSACNLTFDCGSTNGIGYPFWGGSRPPYCGVPSMELNCSTDGTNHARIEINDTPYLVLGIDSWPARTLRIARMDFNSGICMQQQLQNTTLDFKHFQYTTKDVNLTLFYGCTPYATPFVVTCDARNGNGVPPGYVYYNFTRGGVGSDQIDSCKTSLEVTVLETSEPALGTAPTEPMMTAAINQGFEVQWTADVNHCLYCKGLGGSCGYNWTSRQPICFHYYSTWSTQIWEKKLIIGVKSSNKAQVRKKLIMGIICICCLVSVSRSGSHIRTIHIQD